MHNPRLIAFPIAAALSPGYEFCLRARRPKHGASSHPNTCPPASIRSKYPRIALEHLRILNLQNPPEQASLHPGR